MKGIYRVDLNEFEKIFKLLQRKSKRSGEALCMVLFTLISVDDKKLEYVALKEASKNLMKAMDESLRAGDIVTKYNNSH